MEPNIWGKHAWIFLHSVSMNYPDNPSNSDKKNYKDFFENIRFILPCEVCKKHFSQHIQQHPIDSALKSKNKLVEWLIDVHNQVNISLHKPTMTYEQVIDYYKKLYNGDIHMYSNTNKEEKTVTNSNNTKSNSNNTKSNSNNTKSNSNNYLETNIIIIIIITLAVLFYILWKNI